MEEMNETMEVLEQSVEPEVNDGWEEEAVSAQADQPEEQKTTEELFTLKNRDETRQVTREELIAMAQKGWDYDNVRQERDQLRQYRQAMEQLRTTIGVPGKAEGFVGERRRADMSEFSPLGGNEGYKGRVDVAQRVKANAQKQDMERFLQTYPTVKAEEIPREVWGQVAKGVPLVSAYAMHENQQLRVQLAAQRQNQINRVRTPGALGHNIGGELDELDRMWAEDD